MMPKNETAHLGQRRAAHRLQGAFDGIDVFAYIDTLKLFFRRLPPDVLGELNRLQQGLVSSWFNSCQTIDGFTWGWVLTVQQPRLETLLYLDRVAKRYDAKPSRVDVAFDFIGRDERDKRNRSAWLRGHILLRYRRKAYLREDENTVNWIEQNGRKKRSSKDLELYDDRHSKVDGQIDCTHLELKFYNAASVRQQGIERTKDLIDLNPNELFGNHIKLTAFDLDEYVNGCIRKSLRQGLTTGKQSAFTERWNAAASPRLRTIMNMKFQRSAQRAKDILGDKRIDRHTIAIDNLRIPHELSWPLPSQASSKIQLSASSHRPHNGALKSREYFQKGGMISTLTCRVRVDGRKPHRRRK